MKKVVMFCLALLSMFWAAEASARESAVVSAKGAHLWVHPGHHPLADNREAVMNDKSRRADFIKLGLSGSALEEVMKVTAVHGEMRDLADGEMLGNQLYQNGKMVKNVVVKFGNQRVDRSAERWTVNLADGTVIEITLPYVCHNLSVKIVRPSCARILVEVGDGYTEAGVPVWGDSEDAVCRGYRKVGTTSWIDFTRGCETVTCNYDAADALIGRRHTYVGQMNNLTPGWYEVRVAIRHAQDPAFRIGFCLKGYQDGVLAKVSSNPIVRKMDYRQEGGLVARVYASERELPRGVSQDAPGGLFFDH